MTKETTLAPSQRALRLRTLNSAVGEMASIKETCLLRVTDAIRNGEHLK